MTTATAYITSSRGLKYHVAPGDRFIPNILAASGEWEEDVAQIIESELRPGETFLDVGAGFGYFTCLAARTNPVIAIEPSPQQAALVRSNLDENGLDAFVHCCAVSKESGYAYLTVDADEYPGNLGASHVVSSPVDLRQSYERVETRRLMDVLGDRRPEFVKIDIEGLEYEVLADSPELLESARVIVFEASIGQLARYGATVGATVGLLQSAGYEVRHSSGAAFTASVMGLLEANPYAYMNLVARK